MDEECPRCKNPQMSFYTLQLRSVDEGSTVFYKCLKCGYDLNEFRSCIAIHTLSTTSIFMFILSCCFFKQIDQILTYKSFHFKYKEAGTSRFYE